MHRFFLLIVAVLLVSATGCSSSDVPNNETVAIGATTPDSSVATFLEAIRTGDVEVASASLTPLALRRIKENDMDFAPPASETAQYRVGQVEMFEQDKAFVDSVWIEKDADGKLYEEAMTWGLKRIKGQWRISGMAAHMGPNQPPVIVDFENPEQLLGAQDPAPALPGDSTPRQANQPAQDPFNQTISR